MRRTFLLLAVLAAGPVQAQDDFDSWLGAFRQDARAQGISPATLDAALSGLVPNERVIELDRRQPEFLQTFSNYLERRVTPAQVARGQAQLEQHAALLDAVEQKYGIPKAVLVAFWGLETRYGAVLGSLNGITISGPRIYYAMSRDRLFPRVFGTTNRHQVPGRAIWAQAALGIAFLLFFDFNQLTDNVVFISFLFYALAAICLLVLRRTHPDLPRPYKVPGYPAVPILFVVASLAFVGYLVYDQAVNFSGSNLNRLVAFGVVLAGIPVYAFYRAKLVKQAKEQGLPPPEPVFGPAKHT